MTVADQITYWAHYILRHLPAYQELLESSARKWGLRASVGEAERVLGVYRNEPDSDDVDVVLITDEAIHVGDGAHWQRLPYAEMRTISGPPTKTNVEGVSVHMLRGGAVPVPIRGHQGHRFYDAFEFTRFLFRVTEEYSK